MTNSYTRAYTEVLEVLSHFSKEEYSKIPAKKIEFYKHNMDKEYKYKIDPKIDISVQHISKEANAILISLFRDYFATEKQKVTLENLLIHNQLETERKKREKYNPNNIFKDRTPNIKQSDEKNTEIIEYKKSFVSKIFNKIKRIFNK